MNIALSRLRSIFTPAIPTSGLQPAHVRLPAPSGTLPISIRPQVSLMPEVKCTNPKTLFKNQLKQARSNYPSLKNGLVDTPVKIGWLSSVILGFAIPVRLLMAAGLILEIIGAVKAEKSIPKVEPVLLAKMVKSSQDLNPKFIAKQLIYRGGIKELESRGANSPVQKYLSALKEANVSKFNEVNRLLQSKWLRTMGVIKNAVVAIFHWFVLIAYCTLLNYLSTKEGG